MTDKNPFFIAGIIFELLVISLVPSLAIFQGSMEADNSFTIQSVDYTEDVLASAALIATASSYSSEISTSTACDYIIATLSNYSSDDEEEDLEESDTCNYSVITYDCAVSIEYDYIQDNICFEYEDDEIDNQIYYDYSSTDASESNISEASSTDYT